MSDAVSDCESRALFAREPITIWDGARANGVASRESGIWKKSRDKEIGQALASSRWKRPLRWKVSLRASKR